ncbi:MAG: hypothetical protein CBC95_005675 [Crocinitomicaceae bacterium TMED135]|nr:MAG: hypothetical protein CND37_02615 [Bacteroidetes bacterium MED-G20]RPG79071.1 MAG: hypothetical protein CBC95_005675 [Crocinitomicaceae bacterium TMED135]|tara:strand:+ start:13266 stop:13886 length:621 start_codon:yes stop_codon:yes gene_type:complete
MEEFNFKAIENLVKFIGDGISKISPEDLHSIDIEALLDSSRLLNEKLIVLNYLLENRIKDSSSIKEYPKSKDIDKIEENQIDLMDVIVEEEAKSENPIISSSNPNKSINEIHSNSPQTSLADQFGQQSILDLNKEIGINERYLMTENLFAGDSEECSDSIQKLNEFENLIQAKDFLKNELFKKYNWNSKSNHVKRLINLVERRYQN